MDISFASIADNCVIDQFGRIASRKGFQAYTTNPEVLNGIPVRTTYEFTSRAGENYLFATGNNQIFLQQQTSPFELVALTLPVDYVITDDNWQFCSLADVCYMVQANHEPLKFDPTTPTALAPFDFPPSLTGNPNVAIAAFGHNWYADFDDNKSLLVWSDLLIGDNFDGPTANAGSIDLTEVWPSGFDEVVALFAHNNFLVVFGQRSIVIFNVPAEGPAYTNLADTIEGIGCIARDTVQAIGSDVLFLDSTGVRTLGRTIQEKSIPIGDVSINVRSDIKKAIQASDLRRVKSVYHPEDSFYAVFFPDIDLTYVFDNRRSLDSGALRPTRWPNIGICCSARSKERRTWFAGGGGLYEYTGSEDAVYDVAGAMVHVPDPEINATYRVVPIEMKYYTHPQTFDAPANLKFPKQLDITLIGSTDLNLQVFWSFDYSLDTNETEFFRTGGTGAIWGQSQYGVGQYSGANTLLSTEQFNLWGNGRNVKFGFECTVQGTPLSIQELNIQALTGRTI
jgi:hypothetical protein